MYFLVNAFSPKPLDITTSNYCICHMMKRKRAIFCVTLTPRSRSDIKAGICDGVPLTVV